MTSSITIQDEHLKIVMEIFKKYLPGDAQVWVFGSRAKGNAKKFSDLDLAIEANKPLDKTILTNLSFDFEESSLPYKVDIVDLNTVSQSFRDRINLEKVLLLKSHL